MEKERISIKGIPAILYGKPSNQVFIAIHGNKSHKEDPVIELLAKVVCQQGYQVLSFDLPEHGDRQEEATLCVVQECILELKKIFNYALQNYQTISLFGCSLGAYFSLMAYFDIIFKQCLFLSPVVDMKKLLDTMMGWFNIDEATLKEKQIINLPIDEVLYYDYYEYVKKHPVKKWKSKTMILCGSLDNVIDLNDVKAFCQQFQGDLQIMENGEHYFHSEKQLVYLENWIKEKMEG